MEYTPYGEVYASSGSTSDITRRYTGHDWDEAAELYYAPYRYYAPGLARWISRDPLGMVDGPNVYGYVGAGAIGRTDVFGMNWINDLLGWLYKIPNHILSNPVSVPLPDPKVAKCLMDAICVAEMQAVKAAVTDAVPACYDSDSQECKDALEKVVEKTAAYDTCVELAGEPGDLPD